MAWDGPTWALSIFRKLFYAQSRSWVFQHPWGETIAAFRKAHTCRGVAPPSRSGTRTNDPHRYNSRRVLASIFEHWGFRRSYCQVRSQKRFLRLWKAPAGSRPPTPARPAQATDTPAPALSPRGFHQKEANQPAWSSEYRRVTGVAAR